MTPAPKDPPYPRPAAAWSAVALLLAAYIVSWLDRQILSYLIGPIKGAFALSDTEVGLLIGPAFAIFYITLGIPLGWLADRWNRRTMVAIGIALWSFMTAASGFARSFVQLFAARIGVGVGEAVLTPCALSLISDYFPPERRARAVSVYMSGISLGTAFGSIIGGWIVSRVTSTPTVELPIVGVVAGWQATFIVVGLPGLILAMLMMLIAEPARRDRRIISGTAEGAVSFLKALDYFWTRRGAFLGLWISQCIMTVIGYAQFFTAEYFRRTWDWGMAEIGLALGLMFLVFGPTGANFGGWLSDRFTAAGDVGGPMKATVIANLILIPTSVLFPLMPSPELAIAVLGLSTVGGAMASACGAAATVALAPNQVRAQATAVYWVIINLAGLFIGPPLVGFITDRIFGDPAALKYGLAIVPLLVGLPLMVVQIRALKSFREEMAARCA